MIRSRLDALWLAMIAAGLALAVGVVAAWPDQPGESRLIRRPVREAAPPPSSGVLGAVKRVRTEPLRVRPRPVVYGKVVVIETPNGSFTLDVDG